MGILTYTSNPKYTFTTRYEDFELDTNRHPEATVTIPHKDGYYVQLLNFTCLISTDAAGKVAYCTAIAKSAGKTYNGFPIIMTDKTDYINMSFSLNSLIMSTEDVIFYMHMKTSDNTTKAKIKSFSFTYQYVAIPKPVEEEPAKTDEPKETEGDNIDAILYMEGTPPSIEAAIKELKEKYGDKVTIDRYN